MGTPRRARAVTTLCAVLVLIAVILEGCQGPGPAASAPASLSSPASTGSTSSAVATPTPVGGSGGSGNAAVRFSLTLFVEPVGVKGFVLYVRTDDTTRPRIIALCGLKPRPPCDIAHSPFSQLVDGLTPGVSLLYRFESVQPDDSVTLLSQGTVNVQPGTAHIGAAYPQTPT